VKVAIVGAGILGLAHAYLAARNGHTVEVFERSPKASGASIRNFGMIWPIGQPAGEMLEMALRSRQLWLEVLAAANLHHLPTGSLHVVYREDEAAVAREFSEIGPPLGYPCEWLSPEKVQIRSGAVNPDQLFGALWSSSELTVDPRQVICNLPRFLEEQLGVRFHFSCAVQAINLPNVVAGSKTWEADCAIVCSGDDFETLYPTWFASSGITRCKLQMMRTPPQPEGWSLGPSLAAGLTLRFYPSFRICSTLAAFERRIAEETPEYDRWGIHVLVSQTPNGELNLGDSHEYGTAVNIFNRSEIDDLVLAYARNFLRVPDMTIAERWYGVYAKHSTAPFVSLTPAENVHVVTAVGGSGMTLSFGLAERITREAGL
jgi:D-hydroxyproline dehydrogenase subunit beta